MSELERLAGSLLCVGIPGAQADGPLLERLHRLGAGGVVLFSRNVASVDAARRLVTEVSAALDDGDAPSICLDQEGGRVARIDVATPMPSAMTLGASVDVALAERAGAALAGTIRMVGANVNFAPVLDLALDARSTLIGNRAFGDDPDAASELGAALVRGMQHVGVAATPKHFPGHGATPGDSHVAAVAVNTDAATLQGRELAPFRAAFAAGARAVMAGHMTVPAFDGDVPATLSRRLLGDLLRGELDFRGVVFTDCLEMAAVATRFGGPAGAGVRALHAGADALLVSHDLAAAEALRTAIVAAVRSSAVSLARLEEAAHRLRLFRGAHRARPGSAAPTAAEIQRIAHEVAQRGVAVVRGDPSLKRDVPVTIVSFEGVADDGVADASARRPSLSAALRRRRVRSELLRVPLDPDAEMVEQLGDILAAECAQGPRACLVLTRRAHLHAGQQRAIDALLGVAPDAIAVSVLEPFDVAVLGRAVTVVCTFGDEATNIEALADLLMGSLTARGRVPVALRAVPA